MGQHNIPIKSPQTILLSSSERDYTDDVHNGVTNPYPLTEILEKSSYFCIFLFV